MRRTRRTLTVAAGAFLVAAAPVPALIHPQGIAPRSGHRVKAGSRPTFYVRDTAKKGAANVIYFSLTGKKRVNRCGELKNPIDGNGEYKRMFRKQGTLHTYVVRAWGFTSPTFWREKPGTYYWQASRNEPHGKCTGVFSKVYKIRVV